MPRYGLVGKTLGHSWSVPIHGLFGNHDYGLFSLSEQELEGFIKGDSFAGLNVTIPYKKDVIPLCSELSKAAERIGSVNTIVRRADQSLFGDNTDYYGFLTMADSIGLDFKGKKTLILGSGGTCLTAKAAVQDRGGLPLVISRSGEHGYDSLPQHSDAEIIVNTTPVGMHPNVADSPCDLSIFKGLCGVLDVVYNPLYTRLLLQAKELGIPHAGGLVMLVAQAKLAEELFFDRQISKATMQSAVDTIERQMQNIVLIGMPGCGKSTLGQALAKELSLEFFDVDREIEQTAGRSIPEIFEQGGEKFFRELEAEEVSRLAARGPAVIATGGGAIMFEENYKNLKMRGKIVLITRDIELLPTDGRPLSSDKDAIQRLYEQRMPTYKKRADIIAHNDGTIADAVKQLKEKL